MKRSNSLSKNKLNELLTQARDLQWAGQHEKAIKVCTQALDAIGKGNSRTAQIQMDLLVTRAESYYAQEIPDSMQEDARLMMRIANTAPSSHKTKKLALKAQALFWKARVHANVDNNIELARKTYSHAVKYARQGNDKQIEANSLRQLGTYQTGEQSVRTIQQAAELFRSLDDQGGLAKALAQLAWAQLGTGQPDEARQNARTALSMSEQLGDNLGKGLALNALSVMEPDIAQGLILLKQCYQLAETTGYLFGVAGITNNLGVAYSDLGLYPRALRYYQKSLDIRSTDFGGIPLSNIIHIEIEQRDLAQARKYLTELCAMAEADVDPFTEELAGRIALIEGKPIVATRHFKKAIRISQEAGLVKEIGELALLGDAYLTGANLNAALKTTAIAVKKHRELDFPKVDDHPSQNIWWQHSQALRANEKTKEADEALEMAYDFLLKGIESLRDDGLRRNYLNKVRINREILQTWDNYAAKHKLPRERRFAHLEVESSLREPFERLAEISLDLNALHTFEEIQTFLVEEATELSGGERVLLILGKDGELELADSYTPVGEDTQKTLASIRRYLSPARRIRTVQLTHPKRKGLSRIVAPLIAQNQVIGYLYTDMDSLYGKFDDTDRDMLGMLANQGAVALDNASLLEGLERKVEERTAALTQSNKVQKALFKIADAASASRDMQNFYEKVHGVVGELMYAENFFIAEYDDATKMVSWPYVVDSVDDIPPEPRVIDDGPVSHSGTVYVIRHGLPLHASRQDTEELVKQGVLELEGTLDEDWIGIPLKSGKQTIGVLVVQSYLKDVIYTDEDFEVLIYVAQHISTALTRARALEAERQRNAELAIINSVQEGLADKLDIQEIYDLVGNKIRDVFDAQTVNIVTYDHKTDLLYTPYIFEKGKRLEGLNGVPSYGIRKHVIKIRKSLLINRDMEKVSNKLKNPVLVGEDAKSAVFTPMIAGKNVIGVISLQNMDREDAFSDSDVRLLETLANSMSVALQNAQSFKAEQERVAELQIINSIQEGLAAELEFQAIVDLVGDKLREVFDQSDMDIRIFDPGTNMIHFPYSYEKGQRINIDPQEYKGKGFQGHVFRTRKSLVINENMKQAKKKYGSRLLPGTHEVKSQVLTPLVVGGQVRGIISLMDTEHENAFSESDVRLLETLANSMSVALENARLFDETQQRNAELAVINAVQGALAAELDIQGIYDVVGEKLRDIFDFQTVTIYSHVLESNVIHMNYGFEKGQKYPPMDVPINSLYEHILNLDATFVRNGDFPEFSADFKDYKPSQGEIPQSILVTPVIRNKDSDDVVVIALMDIDSGKTFSDTDIRLVETVANAMSVALENARLFDETQRLLKITEERNAELAIINSVQAALAAELNIQGIYDAVGDKIREIYHQADMGIRIYDSKTNMEHFPYSYENGQRIEINSESVGEKGFGVHVYRTRETLVINENMAQALEKYGSYIMPGTQHEKSKVLVPLVTGDQVRGLISLNNYEREHAFSESDVRLLQTLANSMSVALENARLFDETQQRNAELAIINAVQEGLASKLEMQDIYDLVGDKLREIFKADTTWIAFHDEQRETINVPYYADKKVKKTDFTRPYGGGLYEPVVENGKAMIGGSMEEYTKLGATYKVPSPGSKKDLNESFMGAPIFKDGVAIGATSIQSYKKNAYGESDLRLLTTLTNSMSVALESARLFDEVQTRNAEITESLERETASNDILRVIAESPTDIQPVLDVIARNAAQLSGSEDAIIGLVEGETLFVSTHYGDVPMIPVGEGIRFNRDSVAGRAMIDGIPIQGTHNQRSVKSEFPEGDRIAKKYGYRMSAGVPLMRKGKALGVITIRRTQPELLTDKQIAIVQSFANQAAIAVENVRLFEAEQQRVAELQIINSIQEGLAKQLDIQKIIDLVGDKVGEIFNADTTNVGMYDVERDWRLNVHYVDRGERTPFPDGPMNRPSLGATLVDSRKHLLLGTNEESKNLGSLSVASKGESVDKNESYLGVPILTGDNPIGFIAVQSYKQNAYNQDDLRLMQTLANSMSVALENARLFDETQRLLNETEERNAELAIINSIQQGLVSKLDLHSICELVGERFSEIFVEHGIALYLYDEETDMGTPMYVVENGERQYPTSLPPGAIGRRAIEQKKPLILSTRAEFEAIGAITIPGTKPSKSGIFAPLVINEKVIGALNVENPDLENAFTESDLRLVTTIINSMSVALENARLFDETQRLLKITEDRAAELAIINSVQTALASKLEFQGIIDVLGEKFREIFHGQSVGINLLDNDQKLIRVLYLFENGKRYPNLEFPLGQGLTSIVLNTGEPLVINEDGARKAIELGAVYPGDQDDAKSWLGVPIHAGKATIGSIILQDYQHEYAYPEETVNLVKTLASSLGVTLENARLFDETQRLLEETEQRNAELAVINSIQHGLASELDIQAIIDLVGDQVQKTFNVSEVEIAIYNPVARTISIPYWSTSEGRVQQDDLPLGKGVMSHIIQTRQPLIMSAENRDVISKMAVMPGGLPVRKSLIGAPIVSGDEVIGAISIHDPESENAYDDADLRLLTTIANSMAIALKNARLFDETQRLLKETEERNAELAVINSVQGALAENLDIQAIYEIVGNKIQEIFDAQTVIINSYVLETEIRQPRYMIEKGERFYPDSAQLNKLHRNIIENRKTLAYNQNAEAELEKLGAVLVPGSEPVRSAVFVPLLAGNRVFGSISLQNVDHENAFSESELRLLTTIANSMSVALENARLFDETQRLLKETEQRNAELAIVNSVQLGLASKLDMQAIFELVGEKIRGIFDAQVTIIATYDYEKDQANYRYLAEMGERFDGTVMPFNGFHRKMMQERKTILYNENLVEQVKALGFEESFTDFDLPKSALNVPLLVGDQVLGHVALENLDHEHAYSESDVRLLETLANSMSVALESARLFDETQRLLKETEERNAELAIINSVQAALAAELDIQGIYEAVGEKIRKIFHQTDMGIRIYEPSTNLIHFPYGYERGERVAYGQRTMPMPEKGFTAHVFKTLEPLVINENMAEEIEKYGAFLIQGTELEKSAVYVPLVVGNQARGLINLVDMEREHAFSDSDVRLLQTLANAMSVSLENARLFDETQRLLKETEQRAAELALINSVQQGLASKLDIKAIIDLVGDKIRDVFDTQTTYIALHDKKSGTFHIPYYLHRGQRMIVEGNHSVNQGPTGHIIRKRETILFNEDADRRTQELGATNVADDDKPQSWLGVPMIAGDDVVGVISLQNIEHENAYSESDVSLLTTIASSLAVALQNAQLFEETNRLLKETEERNAELAIITSVQQGLASKLDIQAIYDLVGDKIREVLDAQGVVISYYERSTNIIGFPYYLFRGERIREPGFELGKGLTSHVIKTGKTLVINENAAERFKELDAVFARSEREDSVKSWLGVPLISGGQVTGVIHLENYERERAYSDSDVRLLTTLAGSMSVALENARLFDEVQRSNAQIIEALEQQTATSEILSVIANSPTEVQPVLDAVAEKAAKICNSYDAEIVRVDGDAYYTVAHWGSIPVPQETVDTGLPLDDGTVTGHALIEGKTVHIHDVLSTPKGQYRRSKDLSKSTDQRTLLATPLMREGEVTGAIILRRQEVAPFTRKEIDLLKIFADQAAIAIENVRLFNETVRLLTESEMRAQELSAISTVSQALVAETELDNMIQLIGSQMREIFKADIVYVALLDQQTNLIQFPFHYGEDFDTLELGEGLTSKIIQSGKPLLINRDIDKRRKELGTSLIGKEALSYLGVPIHSGKDTIGVLSVQSTTEEGVFDDDDLRLLTTIAANAGAAIQAAQLHTETQRRAREMATLAEIGNDIASSRELKPVLEKIAAHAREILTVRDIAIFLRETDQNVFRASVALGKYPEQLTAVEITPNKGLVGHILESGVAEFVNDPIHDSRLYHIPGTPAEEDEQEFIMGAPLNSRGQTIGGIMVWRQAPANPFTQPDLDFLVSVARQTAIAIESARLYLETQRRAREMSALVDVGRDISASLEAETVLKSIVTHAKVLLNADTSALFLPEEDDKIFRAIAVIGDIAEELRNETIILHEGILGNIALQKSGEIVNDTNADPRAVQIAHTEDIPDEHLMAVPLLANEDLKGLMAVWRTGKDKDFLEAELEFLNSLSRQAVIAVQNAQLFADTTETLEQQRATSEILQVIASSPTDVQPVMDVIAKNARRLLNGNYSAVYLVDGNMINEVATSNLTDKGMQVHAIEYPRPMNYKSSVSSRAVIDRAVQNVPDILNDMSLPEVTQSYARVLNMRSLIAVPMMKDKEAIGAINVGKKESGVFIEKDVALLQTFASQAVIAIENVRLFNETQRLLKETEQRAAELQIINSVQEGLASKLELQAIYDLVGDKIQDIFEAQVVGIYNFDHRTETIYYPYYREKDRRLQLVPRPATPTAKYLISTGQVFLINQNFEKRMKELNLAITPLPDATNPKSVMYAPLLSGGLVIGAIGLKNIDRENAFSDSDVRLLQTLANSMSIALESARLFDEVTQRKEYFEVLFQNNPVAVVTIDNDASVTSWNPAAEELFGYTQEEAIGRNVDELVASQPELHTEAVEFSQAGLDVDSEAFQVLAKRTRKDGSLVDVELSGVPIVVQNKKLGMYALYHDITELQRARQEAIAANEAKSAFLATMSHEIRTPMNAVIGMSGLLLDTKLDKEQLDYAETIRNSGDALLAIINDILDFSKIEAGKMELEMQPFDLRECVESALDLVAGKAVEKGLDLAYLIEDNVPIGIYGDVTRLRQILLNLLSNAVKFTQKGEVVLTVTNSKSKANELLFKVRDTGIGIPKDRIGRLFESFSQIDSSTTRKFGGTGLGLAISKRLAELMGGNMTVQSDGKGKGASFSFNIQAKPAKLIERKRQRDMMGVQPSLEGKRVLVVDDNKTNRRILRLQTKKWGMLPRETKSPKQALRWLKQGEQFDLAILDLQMPVMDGIMLTRELRKLKGMDDLPIILLTSLGRREVEADDLDFAAYLTKPLKPSALFDALAGIFARQKVSVPKSDTAKPTLDPEMAKKHPLRILLAEDNQVNQKLALRLLEQMGYRADVASNGLEAVESVKRQPYDVILMDVQMPEMDGLDATRTIRKEDIKQPYIVAMTANAMQGDREMCLAAGMEFYITKPVRVAELVAALKLAKKKGDNHDGKN